MVHNTHSLYLITLHLKKKKHTQRRTCAERPQTSTTDMYASNPATIRRGRNARNAEKSVREQSCREPLMTTTQHYFTAIYQHTGATFASTITVSSERHYCATAGVACFAQPKRTRAEGSVSYARRDNSRVRGGGGGGEMGRIAVTSLTAPSRP